MTATDLIDDVCSRRGLRRSRVLSNARWQALVDARVEIATELRKQNLSLPRIGEILGRDHSTVIHMLNTRPPESERAKKLPRAAARRKARERALARLEREGWIEDACEEELA